MFNLGPMEIVLLVVVVLIFFGPKRLPALAASIAESVRSFKSGLEGKPETPKEKEQLAHKSEGSYDHESKSAEKDKAKS